MEDLKAAKLRDQKIQVHPYQNASFVSKLFFCWLWPLFYKGYRTDLTEKDIFPPLKSHKASLLGEKLQIAWKRELQSKGNESLWRALRKVFGTEFALLGILVFIQELLFKLSQPLLLYKLLSYYEQVPKITLQEAYTYSALIVLGSFGTVIVSHTYLFCIYHLGMKLRVATSSLIYRKALRLNKSSLAETTVGQMVNLLANDVSRFELTTTHLHNLWLAPVETVVILYLIYIYIGFTAMVGVIFLLLFVPIQLYMGKKASTYRLRTAIRTDERIRLMNEIISGIQVIKMYTWEKPFAKLVELTRRKELQQIQKMSIFRAITMSFNLFLGRIAIYLCIITYVLTGNIPDASYIFVLTSFYGVLRQPMTLFFTIAVMQVAETNISVKRIKQFLLYEEVEQDQDKVNNSFVQKHDVALSEIKTKNETPGIHLKNLNAKWLRSSQDYSLENINIDVGANQIVAVVGPVGSGKTTLLHVILRELPALSGALNITGKVSYASQEPWLFGGSIRQNILFGEEFDPKKYEEVVKVCALERDFTLFPYGDQTLAGERGVTLSGGQRARINLARSIYKEADIYLLDDPLSAVDAHVGKHIFEKCITGYLKNKCVILVTHQLQYLKNFQQIYLFEKGKIQETGDYAQLVNSGKDFVKLLLNEKEEEGKQIETSENLDNKNMENAIDQEIEGPSLEQEGRGVGGIGWIVYKYYVLSGGHWCKIFTLFCIFLTTQLCGSLCDYFLSFWVNIEQNRGSLSTEESLSNITFKLSVNKTNNIIIDKQTKRNLSDIVEPYLNSDVALVVYSILIGIVTILTLSRSLIFYKFCIKASMRIHNSMFSRIVFAPMRFFNTNPSGRILNRFSKDMGSIDEVLPSTLLDTMQIALTVLAVSLVIGSVTPWMLLSGALMMLVFYAIRVVFLSTSRDIKRLEATTRSPIYSHLTASLHGLTTIRAFGAQDILKYEFDNYQNLFSSAYFMFMGANRTFGFWLDLLCVAYISLVTMSFLLIKNETFGGNVGLAITQAMSLTGMVQWGMIQWSELENQMTSVERVKEYTDVKSESSNNKNQPPKNWPELGKIQFENMSLKYASEKPYVLKNLNFVIESTDKVGIVGRTGAGKTSLISALFRLAYVDGRILIDDVDTKELSLQMLRSKLSIIPQEPVLFSGTLRKNLDPFDEYSDDMLWNALEDVELKSVVAHLPHGLDSRVSEGGSNFSVGQRQLLCLARAIVRKNKILVLDEATANVDPKTDTLIQETIRNKFSNCTVLTIAHRLHTIMDSKKVIVMDAGKVVELGHPYELLQKTDGVFYDLVAQTGKTTAQNLKQIAKKAYGHTNVDLA